ncbi:MAG: NLI interacting domain protein, partial [Candidatus Latescibacteria bacterium]|nr:NLI interacting domain protein [Candidatus Latescibacterota bacterium]
MKRPLLILDLDETLIFSIEKPIEAGHDFKCGEYFVHKRPYLAEFISACAQVYEIAVWTSSTARYASCVVEAIFKDVDLAFVWARDRCIKRMDLESHEQYWVKDLKKVKRRGYDLEQVIIVEDSPRNLER